jgi:hypothetical protein
MNVKPDDNIIKKSYSDDNIKSSQKSTNLSQLSYDSDSISTNSVSETFKKWRDGANKLSYIYDYLLDKYKKRVDFFYITSCILTSASSLLSIAYFGLYPDTDPLNIAIKLVIILLTTISAFSTNIIRIKGWGTKIDEQQKYLVLIQAFAASLISQQILPPKHRVDYDYFIDEFKLKFETLLKNAPKISHGDYLESLQDLEKHVNMFKRELILYSV